MPTIHVSNVSGTSALLTQNGASVAKLPAGFSGSLALEGAYTAYKEGVYVVSATVTNIPVVSTNGQSLVTWQNQTSFEALHAFGGPSSVSGTSWTVGEAGRVLFHRANSPTATDRNLPATPDYSSAHLVLTDALDADGLPGVAASWSGATLGQTNYTTNFQGVVHLGDFTAGSMVKGVALHPENLTVSSYEVESQAVALGFGVAFTVLVFGFILRLLRAIPSQGGDF